MKMSVKFKNPKTGKILDDYVVFRGDFCCEYLCEDCPVGKKVKNSLCEKWIHKHPYEAAELMGYEVVEENTSRLDLTKFTDDVGVQCKTEEEAKELLGALHNCGYKWSNGDNFIEHTMWEIYKEQTVYFYSKEDKKVTYGNVRYDYEKNIIQFTDLIVRKGEPMTENIKPRICEILGLDIGEEFTVENESQSCIFHIDDSGRVTTGTCDIASRVLCDIINHPEKIKIALNTSLSEEEKELIKAIQLLYPRAKYIKKTNNGIVVSSISGYITTLQHLEFPNFPMDKEIDITEF